MDFTNAINETDTKRRHELITSEICDEKWFEHIDSHLHRGGFPDDVLIEEIAINDQEKEIVAHISIHF